MNQSISQEKEMPLSENSTYSGPNNGAHNDLTPDSGLLPSLAARDRVPPNEEGAERRLLPYKKQVVRYRECLKNHAAAMGGNATDGCGEFMPAGEEATPQALKCSACDCHRNFHRKETEGDEFLNSPILNNMGKVHLLGNHHAKEYSLGFPSEGLMVSPRTAVMPQQMVMSYRAGSDQSDEHEDHHNQRMSKKRFRTKFSQEQKEKMLGFAEKAGWKIQKQEESVVQQFCQEVGIKRRVLKVWMHNNKNNYANKSTPT